MGPVSLDHTFSLHKAKWNRGERIVKYKEDDGKGLGIIEHESGAASLIRVPDLSKLTTKWTRAKIF